MLNIFNLFLFLFSFWVFLLINSDIFLPVYLMLGVLISLLVSVISFRLKLINKKSELLYLSLGFYCYFFKIYLKSFLISVKLVFVSAFNIRQIKPVIYSIHLQQDRKFNSALLEATINMTAGLFCLNLTSKEIIIHALDHDYYKSFNLDLICQKIEKINDDSLV